MNSNSKKRKKSPSHSVSEKQNTKRNYEGNEAPENSEPHTKYIWTSDALLKKMEPTSDELKYRKQKLESDDNITEKYSKYFKCTKCQLNFKPLIENVEKIAVHSFLKVLFCKKCLEFYQDGEFSVDSDGEEKYCRWCGEGGLIYSCSYCISGFCTACIKKHFGVKYNAQVKKKNNWKCFFCFPKPLWYLRFICSLVVSQINCQALLPNSKPGKASRDESKNSEPKDCNSSQFNSPSSENVFKKLEAEGSCSSCSVVLPDIKEPVSEIVVLGTPDLKKGIKRKRVMYSSSDESDDLIHEKRKKKAKSRESLDSNSNKKCSNQNFVSPEVLDKLEKILRLAEYQMGFGVSWSSKMLTKLFKNNPLNSAEDLKYECQKIKWFFSILSTYLVESCSSVDLIEKSIENCEQKLISSPEKSHQGDYSSVVKFLDFVTNQVKVFLEKGIRLQDLLEGEIYYDNEIIGVKVKPCASSSTSNGSQTVTPRSKIKSNEYKLIDCQINNSEITSDDESIVPTLEAEADRDSSETDMSKKLNLSDPNTDCLEDARDQKSKILEILSILENA